MASPLQMQLASVQAPVSRDTLLLRRCSRIKLRGVQSSTNHVGLDEFLGEKACVGRLLRVPGVRYEGVLRGAIQYLAAFTRC
jgi:hypothetical protein